MEESVVGCMLVLHYDFKLPVDVKVSIFKHFFRGKIPVFHRAFLPAHETWPLKHPKKPMDIKSQSDCTG